jgi:hypothetical protein
LTATNHEVIDEHIGLAISAGAVLGSLARSLAQARAQSERQSAEPGKEDTRNAHSQSRKARRVDDDWQPLDL